MKNVLCVCFLGLLVSKYSNFCNVFADAFDGNDIGMIKHVQDYLHFACVCGVFVVKLYLVLTLFNIVH